MSNPKPNNKDNVKPKKKNKRVIVMQIFAILILASLILSTILGAMGAMGTNPVQTSQTVTQTTYEKTN